MKKNKNRVNKWKEYRNTMESEEGIHFSIVNSSDELKKLFNSINFDIVEAYEKNNHSLHYLKENFLEFIDKDKIKKEDDNIDITNLKINKINIVEN